MTNNYYEIIYKFLHDIKFNDNLLKRLLILGDRYQGIYEFKDADIRFLTLAKKLWNMDFVSLPLQYSYRVTDKIANFINQVMLGQERIMTNKISNHKVEYYKQNRFSIHVDFSRKIIEYTKKQYLPSDIFILAPTLKGQNNPIKKIENKLVENNIPVYYSRNDEEGIDDEIIKGKVVFTTYHQAKGRERKIVFVLGFDDSYFDYHGKDKDRTICPSELYVACTRASEILIVLEDAKEKPLTFLKCNHFELAKNKNVTFYKGTTSQITTKNKLVEKDPIHNTNVVELVRYIGEKNMDMLIHLLHTLFDEISQPNDSKSVDIPLTIKTINGLTEDCSDLNGLVIPALWENKLLGNSSLKEHVYKLMNKKYKKIIEEHCIEYPNNHIAYYLLLGNIYIALNEKIDSKLKQIDGYNWLTQDMIDVCHSNLNHNVNTDAIYEVPLGNNLDDEGLYYEYKTNTYGTIKFRARIDALDKNTLWEFKCTTSIQIDHLLQLVVYAWIYNKCMREVYGQREFKILNIRTGEVKKLNYNKMSHIVDQIIDILLSNKYDTKLKKSDQIFIELCENIRKKYNTINTQYNVQQYDSDISDFHTDDDNNITPKILFNNMFTKSNLQKSNIQKSNSNTNSNNSNTDSGTDSNTDKNTKPKILFNNMFKKKSK
jgi:hypothetical protein